jgi:hypothetical protein
MSIEPENLSVAISDSYPATLPGEVQIITEIVPADCIRSRDVILEE